MRSGAVALMTGMLLQAFAVCLHADVTDLPLPADAHPLARSQQVRIGTVTMTVDSFMTASGLEDTIAFYETSLPRYGWQVELLPWQEDQARVTSAVEKKMRAAQQDGEDVTALRKRVGEYQDVKEKMRQQVYASRHGEHVLVNFMSLGPSTGLFINRWSGSPWWERQRSGADAGVPGQAIGPVKNVCCSSDTVPGLEHGLPFSVPRYPSARPIGQSTTAEGDRTTIILSCADDVPAIGTYYAAQMPRNGWQLVEDAVEPKGTAIAGRMLRYQKPGRSCFIRMARVAEPNGHEPGLTNIVITIEERSPSAGARAAMGSAGPLEGSVGGGVPQ